MLRVFFISIFMIVFFSGCEQKINKELKIGTNLWIGYEPLYLAEELGYTKDKGIKISEFPSASEVIRAYQNSIIDVAALTLDEVLLLVENGFNPKVFLVADISNGADVLLSKPEIKSLNELKNRRVGVENTALGAYFLSRILEIANLSVNDINIVPLEVSEHENAYLNNRVDAVVTFEPVKTKLLKSGANLLFDSSKIKGEIVDVLIVREEFIKEYPKKVNELKEIWFKSLEFMNKNEKFASKFISNRLGIRSDEYFVTLNGIIFPDIEYNSKLVNSNNPLLLSSAKKLLNLMQEKKLIVKELNINSLFER